MIRLLREGALVLVSFTVILLLIEIVLRFLPVTDVTRVRELTETSDPFEVASWPNATLDHSRRWNLLNARERRTNALGFFADHEFVGGFDGTVVIGDSFVEAMQVDFGETFHQRLASEEGVPLYPIAISGAPFSQYEAYLAEACRRFAPARAIIPVIENDFAFSLYDSRERDGFFHYHDDGELKPTPYRIGPIRAIANDSSLIRYLIFHLEAGAALSRLRGGSAEPAARPEGDAAVATERFLDGIDDHCLEKEDILFVVDADRYATPGRTIYDAEPRRADHFSDFLDEARRRGFPAIDLQEPMKEAFVRDGQRFEFPYDEHWNAVAHALVAREIRDSGFLDAP